MVGIKPIDTSKPKIGRRMHVFYLQQVRRTPEIFPKAVSPQTAKLGGGFKLRVHAHPSGGLNGGKFSIELGPRCTEAKLQVVKVRGSASFCPSPGWGPALLQS